MTEQRYLRIIVKWWWLAVAAALLAGLAAYRYTLSQPVLYEASARLIIGPGIDSPSPDTNTLRASGQLIQTYAELPKTGPFLQGVIQRLGLDLTPDQLADSLSVETNAETQIMTIRVRHPSAEQAQKIANDVADRLVELSPSGSGSEQAQLYDQIRVQIANLERTIAVTQARIQKLEADLQAYQETSQTPGEGLLSQDEELNRLLLQFQESTDARELRVASEQILSHLLSNTSARIASLEEALQGTDNLFIRQLIMQQIAAERGHLSDVQSAMAELKRPVDGLPLETYLENLRARIAALEVQLQSTVGTDSRRLVDDQINVERKRLSDALQIEVARQQLVLARVSGERDRVSGLEGLDVEIQTQIQNQIDLERGRLTDQQRTLSSLYQPLQETMANQASVIEAAESASPAPDQKSLYVLLAAMAGLILGLVVAFAYETWADKVESPEDLAAAGGAPVLGKAPAPPLNLERGASPLVVASAPDSQAARGYRLLAARLLFANSSASLRSLLVTSPDSPQEASLAAANLAAVLSAAGRRVILVDANPAGPAAARLFGLPESGGLPAGGTDAPAPRPVASFPGLAVYHGGPQADFALVSPEGLARTLAGFESQADFVLVASPSPDRVESLVLASQVGAVLLVVTANRIRRAALEELAGNLRSAGANLLGYLLRYNPPLYTRLFELAAALARKGPALAREQSGSRREADAAGLASQAELLAPTGLPAPETLAPVGPEAVQEPALEAEAQNGNAPARDPEPAQEQAPVAGAVQEPQTEQEPVLEAEAQNGNASAQETELVLSQAAEPEPAPEPEPARTEGRARSQKRARGVRPSTSDLPSQLEP